jgi:hypothetical protein
MINGSGTATSACSDSTATASKALTFKWGERWLLV